MTRLADFMLPVRVVSEANARGHWAAGHRRASDQRLLARIATAARLNACRFRAAPPYVVLLMRFGKRRLDGDNLQRALKAVRDGVADAIGIDDGDARLTWHYDQAIGETYAVRIAVWTDRALFERPGQDHLCHGSPQRVKSPVRREKVGA